MQPLSLFADHVSQSTELLVLLRIRKWCLSIYLLCKSIYSDAHAHLYDLFYIHPTSEHATFLCSIPVLLFRQFLCKVNTL